MTAHNLINWSFFSNIHQFIHIHTIWIFIQRKWFTKFELTECEIYGKNRFPSSSLTFNLASQSGAGVELDPAVVVAGAGIPPHLSHLGTTKIWRHDGHEEWDLSHKSIQDAWNPWPHWGNTRISSPAVNSLKQIAQSENLTADSSVAVSLGRERRTFFLTPLFAAAGGAVWEARAGEGRRKRRRQPQRATATRPKTQMRAQRRAARITTKSESTTVESEEDELSSSRNLKGRVMWLWFVSEWMNEMKSLKSLLCVALCFLTFQLALELALYK
jgi:hypothetical protein